MLPIRLRLLAPATVLAMAALLVAPADAAAQESTTRGLSLALYLQGASLSVEGGDPGSGGGGGLRIGYGINRTITLFARTDASETDVDDADIEGQWKLAHVELGTRFHFANSLRSWVPWVEAAIGARAVSVDEAEVEGDPTAEEVTFNGSAFSLGGGLDIYFSESLALDVGLAWTSGEFNEIEVGPVSIDGFDLDARSFRFNLGLAWWP